MAEVYGLEPSWEWNTSGKTGKPIQFVRLRSKLAYEDLSNYATYFSADWHLKEPILQSDKSVKKEFLRALFDDEGSVIPERNSKIIRLYSINEKGLLQIQEILNEFGIASSFNSGFGQKRNVFALVIRDIQKFATESGFSLSRKQSKLIG